MKILFLGDIVGRTGRTAVIDALPDLRADPEPRIHERATLR